MGYLWRGLSTKPVHLFPVLARRINMKNILRGMTFFIILFLFFWFIIMPQDNLGYNAAARDKFERLKKIDSPKIVLIGGSNVAFGINSNMLETAFGMTVVNLGLHGGIGQTFGTQLVKENIHEGDIIVLLPESYDYETANIRDGVLTWLAIENDVSLWATLQKSDWPIMIKSFPTYLKKTINMWAKHTGNQITSNVYNRLAFNEYGDSNVVRESNIMENGYIENDGFNCTYLSEALRNYWNNFNDDVVKEGGIVLMSVPPILKEDLKLSDYDLDNLRYQLEQELHIPIISSFKDYIFPKEYFFDTNFHMTNEGAQIRTRLLIQDMQNALKGKEAK